VINRRALIGVLAVLIASGCAQRADWIEGTLVTVDVAGRWSGNHSASQGGGEFDMTLYQTGPKVTGDVTMTLAQPQFRGVSIEGTITGDVLKFGGRDGQLRGEVIVAGDAMTGTVTFGNYGTRTLRLQRQTDGRPESR
jgi:hypothetical protein